MGNESINPVAKGNQIAIIVSLVIIAALVIWLLI